MSWYTVATKPKPVELHGTLCDNNGYIYLSVDNRLFVPFIQMIDNDAVVHPKEVTDKSKDVGAHISVIKKDESDGKKIKEIGKEYSFTIEGLHSVKPDGWDAVKKVYFLTVSSPELENLRKKYDLSPKIEDHEFHITVGVEKQASVKTASLIDNVQVSMFSGDSVVLLIGGRRYEYHGVSGNSINTNISKWKTMLDKHEAGKLLSSLIRNLHDKLIR